MAAIEILDANLIYGTPRNPRYRSQPSAQKMREELAPLGIVGGLVRHTRGLEDHPVSANRVVSKELAGLDGFHPVWTLLPHWTGEFPAPENAAAEMRRGGCRVAAAYPTSHGFGMDEHSIGGLLDVMEEMRMPLVLPAGEMSLDTVDGVLAAHPSLPVILAETGYRLSRRLYPMLDHHANLYVETSMYMLHGGIDDFARHFGAERMLFGSRYVHYQPGAAVAGLMYTELGDDDRRLIAGGNLRRLLEGAAK
jgi:hypothetical protein